MYLLKSQLPNRMGDLPGYLSFILLFSVQEFCTVHRLDAAAMASEWMAFKLSRTVKSIDLDVLQIFEREVRYRLYPWNRNRNARINLIKFNIERPQVVRQIYYFKY